MDIKLSTPTPEDAEGILNLFHKTWLATYPNEELGITTEDIEYSFRDAFSDVAKEKRRERYANIPANQKPVVAKDGDTVVGMMTMMRNETNNQIRTVYVLPEYQGKGIGTMLWEAVKDFADPTKETIVQVADYNIGAIRFYEKLGFVDTGKRWKDEKFKMKSGAYIPEMEMILRKR